MRRVTWVLVAMGLVLVACGGSEDVGGGDPASEETDATVAVSDDRIVGIWITKSGYFKHFRADGTWGIGYTAEGADSNPWVWGTYTFDGNQFTYYTDAQSDNCVMRDIFGDGELSGMVGVYDVTFSEDGTEQFRTVVNDPCDGRVGQDTPKLLRYQEP